MGSVLYIINPAGHGGVGMKVWEEFKSLWPKPIDSEDVIVTERPGHAREIAAARSDYEILAAVGGDGTVGEVMSGIMERRGPKSKVAIIPCGTGNDIGRNTGIFSVTDAVDAQRAGHERKFDLIRIDCQVDGRKAHRYAFLLGNVGFSPIPMIKPWMKRYLGPKGAYYLGTILQIIAYRAPHMTVLWEEQEYSESAWIVIVGNVERTAGGSMCLSPGAHPDDGELNASIIPSRSKFNMMTKMMPQIASGRHINEPDVSYFLAKKIAVDCDPPGIVEVDGDIFGTTPAEFSVCPQAVQVLCSEKADKESV